MPNFSLIGRCVWIMVALAHLMIYAPFAQAALAEPSSMATGCTECGAACQALDQDCQAPSTADSGCPEMSGCAIGCGCIGYGLAAFYTPYDLGALGIFLDFRPHYASLFLANKFEPPRPSLSL